MAYAAPVGGVAPLSPADPNEAFRARVDDAINSDNQEEIRKIVAEMQANPDLGNQPHPAFGGSSIREVLQWATEPARPQSDRAIDQMRVPGKGSGVDQRVPGYDYGGAPLATGDIESGSPGMTAQQMGGGAAPTPARPAEGGGYPGEPTSAELAGQPGTQPSAPQSSGQGGFSVEPVPADPDAPAPSPSPQQGDEMPLRPPDEADRRPPPKGAPASSFAFVDRETGKTLAVVNYDDIAEHNRGQFMKAFEASMAHARPEDESARRMAAAYAASTGMSPELAWQMYQEMVEPQLKRETSERNAQAMSMQRRDSSGFGQELGLRKYATSQWEQFKRTNKIKELKDEAAGFRGAYSQLLESMKKGGIGVLDQSALRFWMRAIESGRLSNEDAKAYMNGLGTVWYDIKNWLEQRAIGNISSDEFVSRGVDALQGMPADRRRAFLESIRIVYENRVKELQRRYMDAKELLRSAGSEAEANQFKRHITTDFSDFAQEDPDFGGSIPRASSGQGGGQQSSSLSISKRGAAMDEPSPEEVDGILEETEYAPPR